MADFREFEDVVFIAGRTFQSEFGTHVAGTEVEDAKEFQNLQVLVDNNFLYPVAPEEGYNYLPPHLFKHIDVKDEVMAKLRGALSPNPDHFQDGKKPESMLLAEREARQKLTEMTGDTEEAREVRRRAVEEAAGQYHELQTVDANPAYQDKGGDLTKFYKGDQAAWEVLEKQGDAVAEEIKETPTVEISEPVNLRKADKPEEEDLKDEENPDKSASKTPVEETKAVADPVGKQPSNVSEGGSHDVTRTDTKTTTVEAKSADAKAAEETKTAPKPTARTTASKTATPKSSSK